MSVKNLYLVSPWVKYYHELMAMFKYDPQVQVVLEDEDEKILKVYVDNKKKAKALSVLLPDNYKCGNIIINVEVIPSNKGEGTFAVNSPCDIFKAAFENNPALDFTQDVFLYGGTWSYVVFRNEAVQYFTDDIGDLFGCETTVFEAIARDVFNDIENVFFCTNFPDVPTDR